ncbi:MAG: hypothetical protein IKU73_06500 [Clostridia bacterium]|nr:hypothetical protein [Clostridia bacterium]
MDGKRLAAACMLALDALCMQAACAFLAGKQMGLAAMAGRMRLRAA